MKTVKILLALGVVTLPLTAMAQVANNANSPTSSGDSGLQKATPTATPLEPTTAPSVDQTTTSSTTDQRGGSTDIGMPHDTASPSPTP